MNENGWENYSRLVLQQLETLSGGIEGLRVELQNVKNQLTEICTKTLPYLIEYVKLNPNSKAGLNNLASVYYKLGMEEESTKTRDYLNSLE